MKLFRAKHNFAKCLITTKESFLLNKINIPIRPPIKCEFRIEIKERKIPFDREFNCEFCHNGNGRKVLFLISRIRQKEYNIPTWGVLRLCTFFFIFNSLTLQPTLFLFLECKQDFKKVFFSVRYKSRVSARHSKKKG